MHSFQLLSRFSHEGLRPLALAIFSAVFSQGAVAGVLTDDYVFQGTEVLEGIQAENGAVRTYTIHVARQSGGAVASGSLGQGTSSEASSPSGGGPGVTGPGASVNSGNTPGGSNVTVVTVTN